MRSVSVALAALIGAAAANPADLWPRYYSYNQPLSQTGVSSSSSSYSASPSSSVYYSSSSTKPYSSQGTGYSSTKPYSSQGTGYSSSIPSSSSKYQSYPHSTGGYPSYSTGGHHPHSSHATGVSSKPQPPLSTGYPGDQTITTYTTTTVCPITTTIGTQVITTTTTSTITVTSCKGGCNYKPTTPVIPPPSNTGNPITVPTTYLSTVWSFAPSSTSVGQNGGKTIYSTALASTPIVNTIYTSYITYPTVVPPPQPPVTVATPAGSNCPAPVTVYSTVTVVAGQTPCYDCTVKTYTVTESGKPITITVTDRPNESTYTPVGTPSSKPIVTGTGGSGYSSLPYSTGSVVYPTKGQSSSIAYSSSYGVPPKPSSTGYVKNYHV
jgi:hypothetical protein